MEAHANGIVTSASLMVTGAAATAAALLSRERPALGIGLHWDLDGEHRPRTVDMEDTSAVRAELIGQFRAFGELMGRPPTHLDSHHHTHRTPEVAPIAQELAGSLGLPLRENGRVSFVGTFYGQGERGVPELEHVSPEFLIWILRNELADGWTELGCHPGYVGDNFVSAYLAEREVELATLTDPRAREEISRLGITLASYASPSPRPR